MREVVIRRLLTVWIPQALARAVYARREICVLDDVFSGLDASTENLVFHSLLGERGLLRDLRTTVILVSSDGMSPCSSPQVSHLLTASVASQTPPERRSHHLPWA